MSGKKEKCENESEIKIKMKVKENVSKNWPDKKDLFDKKMKFEKHLKDIHGILTFKTMGRNPVYCSWIKKYPPPHLFLLVLFLCLFYVMLGKG